MGQTFADGIAPWDIIISLAICRHDEKTETGKKEKFAGILKTANGSNCSGKPENDEINYKLNDQFL